MRKAFLVFIGIALSFSVALGANQPLQGQGGKDFQHQQQELKRAYEVSRARASNSKLPLTKPNVPAKDWKKTKTQKSFVNKVKADIKNSAASVFQKIKFTIYGFAESLKSNVRIWFNSWCTKAKLTYNSASYWTRKNILRDERLLTNLPPVIDEFVSQTITSGSRPLSHLVSPSPITDPDGTVDHIVWEFGDGTSMTIPFSEIGEHAEIYHIYDQPGHYVPKLTACDDLNACASYEAYFEIINNEVPVSRFSVTSMNPGSSPGATTVEFGSAAWDPENRLSWYEWDFGDGSPLQMGDDLTAPSHEYAADGDYLVTFTVYDSDLGRGSVTGRVIIGPTSLDGIEPSIFLDSTNIVGRNPLTVHFDASNSFMLDGTDIESFEWDFQDFDYPDSYDTGAQVSHTFRRPGSYYGRLRATSDEGISADYYFVVFVEGDAVYAPDIIAYQDDDSRLIRFESSPFAPRTNANYQSFFWDFGDGNTSVGEYAEHEYASDGTYTVKLVAHDVHGVRHDVEKDITVTDINDSPENQMNWSEDWPQVGQSVDFEGSESSDPGQSLALDFLWDFGDGSRGTSDDLSHTYQEKGLHSVQLTITNTRGISSSNSAILSAIEDSYPNTRLVFSPKIGVAPLTVNFDATLTKPNGADVTKYVWEVNGTYLYGSTTSYTFDDPGTYYVQLFTYDSAGNIGVKGREVTVLDAGDIPPGNLPPVASFTMDVDPENSRRYNFDGEDSTDSDGDIQYYEWRIDGVLLQDESDLWYTFPAGGIHTVELTVYDEWGASNSTSQQLDFSEVPNPQLLFDYAPLRPIAAETIKFGAENTIIPGETIASYNWDFGDSTTGTGISATHSYASAGTYTVELEITDSHNHVYTVTQDVVVAAAAANPTLRAAMLDVDNTRNIDVGNTYNGTSFPETVRFSLRPTIATDRFIRRGAWGTGVGYSPEAEYTFAVPGTYTFSVIGLDANERSASTSVTVVIPNDCKRREGETACLSLPEINNPLPTNVLPMSWSSWTITATATFATDPKFFPDNWIQLEALDGSEDIIPIANSVTVSGDQITIYKQPIVDSKIDLRRPYRLVVNTADDSGAPLVAEWPILHFGAGQLKITTPEDGYRLTLINPSAQFRKGISVTSMEALELDLPLGPTSIVARLDDEVVAYSVNLTANKLETLEVDVSSIIKKQRKVASAKKAKKSGKSFAENWKDRELGILKKSGKSSSLKAQNQNRDLPPWAFGLCGEEPPFNKTAERTLSEDQTPTWSFSSADPMAQASYRSIPDVMSRPIRLSCGISSDSLAYGYNKWKYKEGPARCHNDPTPHWYWSWYKKHLPYEDELVTIRYEVKDDWTNDFYAGYIVTSASDMMRKFGRELNDVTSRVGIVPGENGDWSYRQNFDLYIPPQFRRPQIRFELESAHSEEAGNFYSVNCDVITTDAQLKIVGLHSSGFNSTTRPADRNGQYSLQSRYKLFPVHYNGNSDSAHAIDAGLSRARYEVDIRRYQAGDFDPTGVEVEFIYDGVSHKETFAFDSLLRENPITRVSTYQLTFDTSVMANWFSWSRGVDRIRLKFTPVGVNALDEPVRGKAWIEDYFAMFDAQVVQEDQSENLCSRGFFGNIAESAVPLTTFAQESVIRALHDVSETGLQIRCGSMSLPFGGPMYLTGLESNSHRHGLEASLRTFNDDEGTQDSYDEYDASDRANDLSAYMTFSDAARTISEIEDEYDGPNPTDKKKIFDFCVPISGEPKFPCHQNTTFEELDHDMILKICQWYSDSGAEIDGCPSSFLEPVIRYSKWVKRNTSDLLAIQALGIIRFNMSGGENFDADSLKPFQKRAIVFGRWPDGKPIWAISTGGTELSPNSLVSCHSDQKGCWQLEESFSHNGKPGFIELLTNWRL